MTRTAEACQIRPDEDSDGTDAANVGLVSTPPSREELLAAQQALWAQASRCEETA